MSYFRTFFIISLMMVSGLLIALLVKMCSKERHVAPDIEMIQNCETMITSVHLFNPDTKAMRIAYNVYVDLNDNAMLDSTDLYVYGEPNKTLGPQAEDQGMGIGILPKYKGYSLIVKATTDDVIAYYASIPCDVNLSERDSTPTK